MTAAPRMAPPLLAEDGASSAPESASEDGSPVRRTPTHEWQHPPSFLCPISQQCMHDPVVLSDGHTYERQHIQRWLSHSTTSPVTRQELTGTSMYPNHALRNAIDEYFNECFCVHRQTIRRTIRRRGTRDLAANARLLRTVDALMECSLLVNADHSVEHKLRHIMNEAKMLVGAEVASVFLVDASEQELYSSVNSTGVELRIPIGAGIAGHVAMTGETVIIDDAYADARFINTVDRKTGFRTRTVLCAPLTVKGRVLGVVQLINKADGGVTTSGAQGRGACSHSRPEAAVGRLRPGMSLAKSSDEGSCFTADDSHFLQVFASQAATAIVNSGTVRELDQPHLQVGQPELPPTALASEAEADGLDAAPAKAQPACKKGGQALGIPQEAATLLEQSLDGWDLDVARLAQLTGNRPLSSLGCFLLDRLGLVARFGLDSQKVSSFFLELERGYDEAVQYHNRAHAASVLHLTHAALRSGSLAQRAAAALRHGQGAAAPDGALETMACLLAAACHDYEHPGRTNDFLVKTGHERAVRYNDSHVNENHHAAAAFALLQRPGLDFLAALPGEELRRFRDLFLQLILGTDMSSDRCILGSFEAALEKFAGAPAVSPRGGASQVAPGGGGFVPGSPEEAVLLLQVAFKGADLGHLTLGRAAHLRFVGCLEREFFAQGDREKSLGLPASFLMDRDKPGPSSSQVGFFEFVALPLYRTLAKACPSLQPMLAGAEDNYRYWKNIQSEAA